GDGPRWRPAAASTVAWRRPGVEDGKEPALEQRADHLPESVLAGARQSLRLERGLLTKNRGVQLLQGRGRLDAELVDQHLARVLVGLQRLCLPPTAIEGEHELATRTLAHGVLTHELLELTDEASCSTALELDLHPLLDGG